MLALNELFEKLGLAAAREAAIRNMVLATMEVPADLVDPHVHLRDIPDGRQGMAKTAYAGWTVIDIGNVPSTEITSLRLMEERDRHMHANWTGDKKARVYYAPLVGKGGDPNIMKDIRAQAPSERKAVCVKVFFDKVSNAKTAIVDVSEIRGIIEDSTVGEGPPTPITWHAECLRNKKGRLIPIKNREYYCVTKQIERALAFNPNAVHVIRHVSDWRTVEWAIRKRAEGYNIHLEVSLQYLLQTEDSIFTADDASHTVLQCNCVFWPRPKSEKSRQKMVWLILQGFDWVHIGSDFAIHLDDMTQESGVKINSAGIAVGGLTIRPVDIVAFVLEFCFANGRPDLVTGLLSKNAASLYNIPVSDRTVRYVRTPSIIPTHLHGVNDNGKSVRARLFLGGHPSPWQRETPSAA